MKLFTKARDKKQNTNRRSEGNFSCRHPKLWSYIKSNVKAFFITGTITFVVSASATTILHSRQVRYKNDKSVETAINELYQKADECYGYHIEDEITVAGETYYVIADSPATQDYVTALKAEPLTVAEVNEYGGVGTDNNHVNVHAGNSNNEAWDNNGYGSLAYFSDANCGCELNNSYPTNTVEISCVSDYSLSDIKYVVDNWSNSIFSNDELKTINNYKARLITNNEYNLLSSFSWRYDSNYLYWTMSSVNNRQVYFVNNDGSIGYNNIPTAAGGRSASVYFLWQYRVGYGGVVRPVINVYKSAITRVNNN